MVAMANQKAINRVLLVDDEEEQRRNLEQLVARGGFTVMGASDGHEALEQLEAFEPDVIVTDLMMPRMDGFELLRRLSEIGDRTPTIVLTSFGSIEKAIDTVHDLKAFWFVEKPAAPGILLALIERAAAQKKLQSETERLTRQLSYEGVLGDLVGTSRAMQMVYTLIRQVAPTKASVLITGESGTGKELVARAIHSLSPRAQSSFVAVNCAALPETLMESELFGHEEGAFTGAVGRGVGSFEQAHGGTLLLDEIGEMPIGTQAKLLRVLEDHNVRRLGGRQDVPVDVRVISATNRNPSRAIESKSLREDLYFPLNVFQINLPPLRQRKQD